MPERSRVKPSLRVAADLRRRVEAGEWAAGRALPSVAKLAEEYATSRSTITRALHMLAVEGLVEVESRWGTFVSGDGEGPGE
jgi:GntR family transcriptional regulator